MTSVTVVLWLLGVALAAFGMWSNATWDRQFRDTGLRDRSHVIDVLFLIGAIVLPWGVYVMGYNVCWT